MIDRRGLVATLGATMTADKVPHAWAQGAGSATAEAAAEPARAPAPLPPDFEHHTVDVDGLKMHCYAGGTGAPLVLVHGWPQSSHAWRKVAPLLADRFRVVVPDLRGFGDTAKPDGGYDTRTMAGDVRGLMRGLGHDGPVQVVGTDMGETVAFAYAAFFPDDVRRLVLCEMVVPGFGTQELAPRLWHWGLLRAGHTAEILVEGRERAYLTDHFGPPFLTDPDAIEPAALEEYVRVYEQPGAFSASIKMYRSLADSERQNQERVAEAGKLRMPVLAVGAERSLAGTVMESAARVSLDMRGRLLPGSGHYIAEEKPTELAAILRDFLVA